MADRSHFRRGFRLLIAVLTTACGACAHRPTGAGGDGAVLPIAGPAPVDITAWVVEVHNPPTPHLPSRTTAPGRSERQGPSVANRNRNPLNIKLGAITRRLVEGGRARISTIEPLDGGRFLQFAAPEHGFRAGIDLLMSPAYRGLALHEVFRRWTNNGFGPEILTRTGLDGTAKVRELDRDELRILLHAMATAEGYRSAGIRHEIASALNR